MHTPFCRAIIKLEKNPQKIVCKWWARQTKDYFERLVDIFKGVALHIIHFNLKPQQAQKQCIGYEPNLEIALRIMQLLSRINHMYRVHKVPYDIFHLPELVEVANLQHDYIYWLMDKNVSRCTFLKILVLMDFIFFFSAKQILSL